MIVSWTHVGGVIKMGFDVNGDMWKLLMVEDAAGKKRPLMTVTGLRDIDGKKTLCVIDRYFSDVPHGGCDDEG